MEIEVVVAFSSPQECLLMHLFLRLLQLLDFQKLMENLSDLRLSYSLYSRENE